MSSLPEKKDSADIDYIDGGTKGRVKIRPDSSSENPGALASGTRSGSSGGGPCSAQGVIVWDGFLEHV